MITGKQKRELSKETILSLLSEWQIYKYYLDGLVSLGKPFCNPLRGDEHPSMQVDVLDIGMRHIDYGDDRYRGDCIDLVKQKFGCDFNTALLQINKDFALGLVGKVSLKSTPIIIHPPKEDIMKSPHIIRVKTRKSFNTEELQWWRGYGIGLDELKKNDIYAPKEIIRNGVKLPMVFMTFCYFYPEIECWKLYRPTGMKRNKETYAWQFKWDSNVPSTYTSFLNEIKGCERAFLTKSRKDKMVLNRLLRTNCIAVVESENKACITENVISHFKKNSQQQYSVIDSDRTGKQFSWWLTREYGFKHLNTPDYLLEEGINDFAGWVNKYGDGPALEFLHKKGLI